MADATPRDHAAPTWSSRAAPARAPPNMDTREVARLRAVRVGPAGQRGIRSQSGQRGGQHGRRHVGDTKAPNGHVARAHGERQQGDHGVSRCPVPDHRHRGGDQRGHGGEDGLEHHHGQHHRPVGMDPPGEGAGQDGAGQEEAEGAQARRHGESGGAGRREAEKHDVARHVRREDMAETEVAHRIEEPAHHGQAGQGHDQGTGVAPSCSSGGRSSGSPASTSAVATDQRRDRQGSGRPFTRDERSHAAPSRPPGDHAKPGRRLSVHRRGGAWGPRCRRG